MLIDKGYYDYDYSEPKKIRPERPKDNTLMSDEDVAAILATAVILGTNTLVHNQSITAEQLQTEVREEEEKKRAANRQ